MATEEQVNNVKTLIEECTEIEITNLIENPKWGSINFSNAKIYLERFYSMCFHLKVLPLEQLPDDIAIQIHKQGLPIKETIKKIRDFTIEQPNPAAARDNLIAEAKTHTDQFYMTAHLYIPYLAYQQGEVQQNIKELTSYKQQASELLKITQEEVEQRRKDIDETVRVILQIPCPSHFHNKCA